MGILVTWDVGRMWPIMMHNSSVRDDWQFRQPHRVDDITDAPRRLVRLKNSHPPRTKCRFCSLECFCSASAWLCFIKCFKNVQTAHNNMVWCGQFNNVPELSIATISLHSLLCIPVKIAHFAGNPYLLLLFWCNKPDCWKVNASPILSSVPQIRLHYPDCLHNLWHVSDL